MKILQFLQWLIITTFITLSLLLISFFEPSFADINIPFDRDESGLDVIPQGEDLVKEDAPDKGSDQLVDIIITVFHTMKWALGFIVLLWVVISGAYMISSSASTDSVESAKKMMMYSIAGLVVMLLAEPFVLDIFYGGGNAGVLHTATLEETMKAKSDNLRLQISGVIDFVKTLLVFIAMAYIIFSGVRMILAFGNDEKLGTAKQMFLPIGLGILVIVFNEVFIDYILYDIIFDGETVKFGAESSKVEVFVKQLIGFLQYLLQFIALLVFGFMVYGGMLYIASFGDEERAGKGKDIFINAFWGMVILIFSYVLMMSLVNFSISG